jgi:hypothetical protein
MIKARARAELTDPATILRQAAKEYVGYDPRVDEKRSDNDQDTTGSLAGDE